MAMVAVATLRVCMHATPENPGGECGTPSLQNPAQGGRLRLDVERYRHHLDGLNLSEAQATEMLNALWSLLSAFVDLGFGVDSVHLALPQSKEGALKTDATAETVISAQQPGIHAVKEPRS